MKRIFFLLCLILLSSSFTFYNKESSYCVMEVSSKRVLEQNNMDKKLLIASTTKILTALTVIEYYDLDDNITVSKDNTNAVGSSVYLKENEILTIKDLLYALLLRSANDAASCLSYCDSNSFILKMNELAKKIGMYNSVFYNASGLDEDEYNLSTAYDMALLSSYASLNKTFVEIASTHVYKFKTNMSNYVFINKHRLVKTNDDFLWGKTGFTKKSRRILVSNYLHENMNLVIVTINNSSDWSFHKNIINSLKEYRFVVIYKKGIYKHEDLYVIVNHDLIIPLTDEEVNKVILTFFLCEKYGFIEASIKGCYLTKFNIEIKKEKELTFLDYIELL